MERVWVNKNDLLDKFPEKYEKNMTAQPKEITIVLKGEDKTYKQKFLCYEEISVNGDDPEIDRCIKEAKTNFVGDPEEIQVRILLQL